MKKIKILEVYFLLSVLLFIISFSHTNDSMTTNIGILSSIFLVILYSLIKRYSLSLIFKSIAKSIRGSIMPAFIFILVGILVSVWIESGVIPTLMVISLKYINADWFIPCIFLICSVTGTILGSAFTVISTVGIAFFSVGSTLGLNTALITGAIVSGSVFGDKVSPFSTSTNLCTMVTGTNLFLHVKNITRSSGLSFIFSFLLFKILGQNNYTMNTIEINNIMELLTNNFLVSNWCLFPLFFVFFCAWKKIPSTLTLISNIIIALAMIHIQHPDRKLYFVLKLITSGYFSNTDDKPVDFLISRGGILNVLPTIILVIFSLSLGGLLMDTGIISSLMNSIVPKLKYPKQIIFSTLFFSMGINLFIGEQLLSIILPGKAFKKIYKKKKIDLLILSNTLEEGGTVMHYLVPWGVSGTFISSTFNIQPTKYLPFVFFSLFSLFFSILSSIRNNSFKKIKY